MNSALLLHVFNEFKVVIKLVEHNLHQDHSLKRNIIDFPHSCNDLFVLVDSVDKVLDFIGENLSFGVFVLEQPED